MTTTTQKHPMVFHGLQNLVKTLKPDFGTLPKLAQTLSRQLSATLLYALAAPGDLWAPKLTKPVRVTGQVVPSTLNVPPTSSHLAKPDSSFSSS